MTKNNLLSRINGTLALAFFIAILVYATTSYQSLNAQQSLITQDEKTKVLLANTVEAFGGLETIQDVETQLIMAEGNRFESGQKFEPIELPLPVSNFSYDQSTCTVVDSWTNLQFGLITNLSRLFHYAHNNLYHSL